MTTNIYIENWRVDLYKDENISVNASVLDINDIKKNTSPFTMNFTVPASKNNNKLFKHWYNANIDNTFDARSKVDGTIFIGGIKPKFGKGKFRLSKVNVKKNKPTSYSINFFGNLVSLVDLVKKDELKDLDGLQAYNHTYNSNNVKLGLTDNLFSGAIKYSLFAKKQYYYNSAPDNTQTTTLANIAHGGGADTGVIWSDLRPSLQIIKVIEAVESQYNIVFTREFFGLTEFTGLYMWLNNTSTEEVKTNQLIDWDGGNSTYMNHTTDIATYPVSWSSLFPDLFFTLELTVTPAAGFEAIEYKVLYYRDGELEAEITETNTSTNDFTVIALQPNTSVDTDIYFEIQTTESFSYTSDLLQVGFTRLPGDPFPTEFFRETTTASINSITSNIDIKNNIPKLKIIDFLKGVFDLSKLVVKPLDNGDTYVNTLNGYYAEGNTYDITKYVDFENVDIDRGKILNNISYKFEEPTTILGKQFLENTGQAYGDEDLILYTDSTETEMLDGESLEIKVPFEQILYDRLVDQSDNTKTNVMYAPIIDEERKPVNPKPHLYYNARINIAAKPIGFINDLGVKELINTQINTPLHGNGTNNPAFSTLFGREYGEYSGNAIENTLFKNHWENYIQAIFNIKKREFTYKGVLPLKIISKLDLNDVLHIKGNYYRINNYSHNLTTGETTLNLVNSFDNTINPFVATPTTFNEDFEAVVETVYITNSKGATTSKTDLGHGTGWVTINTLTTNANTFFISIDENTTTEVRDMLVVFTQVDTGETQTVYIIQSPETYVPSLDFSDARNSWQLSLLTLRT